LHAADAVPSDQPLAFAPQDEADPVTADNEPSNVTD